MYLDSSHVHYIKASIAPCGLALSRPVVSITVTEGVTPSLRRMAASRMIRQQLRRIQEQLRLPAEQLVKLGAQEDVRGALQCELFSLASLLVCI